MKKKLVIWVLVVLIALVAATPALAGSDGNGPTGKPGWSHQNSGQGGSDSPGPGGS